MDILKQLIEVWEKDRDRIDAVGDKVTQVLQSQGQGTPGKLDESILEEAFGEFSINFDAKYGGFGSAPKFPIPHNILFLLRYWHKTRRKQSFTNGGENLGCHGQGRYL